MTAGRGRRPVVLVAAATLALLAGLTACSGTDSPAAAPTTPAPSTSEPSTTEPSSTEPDVTEPSTTEPEVTTDTPSPTDTPVEPAPPSVTPTPSASIKTPRPTGVATPLKPGARGADVADVQRRLLALGYWLPAVDGSYGDGTRHAVVALQKAAGLSRDGILGPATRRALDSGTRWAPAEQGDAIVVDLKLQLLGVVRDGKLVRTLDVSTGSGITYRQPDGDMATATTPTGRFRVEWQVNGWRTSQLGHLYRPKYFHPRGIAVHGFTSVPPRAASHGCVRVTMAAMDMIWREGLMPIGTRVIVR